MKVVSFSIFKGGTGKTTSTVSTAAALVKKGKKVLIVDLDQQASATRYLDRACRRIHEEVIQTSYSSFPLFFSLRFRSLSLIPISYLVKSTKSRMNLFRLNDKIDLGPAISSVCQRRSFGLLNL